MAGHACGATLTFSNRLVASQRRSCKESKAAISRRCHKRPFRASHHLIRCCSRNHGMLSVVAVSCSLPRRCSLPGTRRLRGHLHWDGPRRWRAQQSRAHKLRLRARGWLVQLKVATALTAEAVAAPAAQHRHPRAGVAAIAARRQWQRRRHRFKATAGPLRIGTKPSPVRPSRILAKRYCALKS